MPHMRKVQIEFFYPPEVGKTKVEKDILATNLAKKFGRMPVRVMHGNGVTTNIYPYKTSVKVGRKVYGK